MAGLNLQCRTHRCRRDIEMERRHGFAAAPKDLARASENGHSSRNPAAAKAPVTLLSRLFFTLIAEHDLLPLAPDKVALRQKIIGRHAAVLFLQGPAVDR